mmetsp:Transcript_11191/g.31276  ORF Transcript_11191/g.31276 Transcript_11191/m.31276 type:complete len:271 (-) Transcript_11191:38-850(-)
MSLVSLVTLPSASPHVQFAHAFFGALPPSTPQPVFSASIGCVLPLPPLAALAPLPPLAPYSSPSSSSSSISSSSSSAPTVQTAARSLTASAVSATPSLITDIRSAALLATRCPRTTPSPTSTPRKPSITSNDLMWTPPSASTTHTIQPPSLTNRTALRTNPSNAAGDVGANPRFPAGSGTTTTASYTVVVIRRRGMVSTADVITWIACGRGGEPVLDGPSEVDCWARVATARRTAGSSIASTDADVRSRTLDCPSACAALSSSTMKNGAV